MNIIIRGCRLFRQGCYSNKFQTFWALKLQETFFSIFCCFYRAEFDEGTVKSLIEEEIRLDMHTITAVLKMYFRELPNPLLTYQLYENFSVCICNNTQVKQTYMNDGSDVCCISRFSYKIHHCFISINKNMQRMGAAHQRSRSLGVLGLYMTQWD